jgi:hypothetical protein
MKAKIMSINNFRFFVLVIAAILILQNSSFGQVKTTATKPSSNNLTSPQTVKKMPLNVSTDEMIFIYDTKATCKFTVSGLTYTECGVCYSLKSNPTVNDMKKISKSVDLNQQIELDPLNPETTYYVRAYVKDPSGLLYGNELSFTTKESMKTETKTKPMPRQKSENPG